MLPEGERASNRSSTASTRSASSRRASAVNQRWSGSPWSAGPRHRARPRPAAPRRRGPRPAAARRARRRAAARTRRTSTSASRGVAVGGAGDGVVTERGAEPRHVVLQRIPRPAGISAPHSARSAHPPPSGGRTGARGARATPPASSRSPARGGPPQRLRTVRAAGLQRMRHRARRSRTSPSPSASLSTARPGRRAELERDSSARTGVTARPDGSDPDRGRASSASPEEARR